jgi:hypothetical protein
MRYRLSDVTSGRASHFARSWALACGLALLGQASCSVLPARGNPPWQVREVVVRYELEGAGARVEVPASGPGLTVLALRTDPPHAREHFDDGKRFLLAPGPSLVVHCRYRVAPRDARAKTLEFPAPDELFPGATSIDSLDPAHQ